LEGAAPSCHGGASDAAFRAFVATRKFRVTKSCVGGFWSVSGCSAKATEAVS
jgi:hypothetical protein